MAEALSNSFGLENMDILDDFNKMDSMLLATNSTIDSQQLSGTALQADVIDCWLLPQQEKTSTTDQMLSEVELDWSARLPDVPCNTPTDTTMKWDN
jgi:hypothetical protein